MGVAVTSYPVRKPGLPGLAPMSPSEFLRTEIRPACHKSAHAWCDTAIAILEESNQLIGPDFAERLALIVGASPEFWQNLSETYRRQTESIHA